PSRLHRRDFGLNAGYVYSQAIRILFVEASKQVHRGLFAHWTPIWFIVPSLLKIVQRLAHHGGAGTAFSKAVLRRRDVLVKEVQRRRNGSSAPRLVVQRLDVLMHAVAILGATFKSSS